MTQSTFTNHDSTNLTFNFDNFNCYLYFATFRHPPPPTAKLKKKTIIPQMNSELFFDRVRL